MTVDLEKLEANLQIITLNNKSICFNVPVWNSYLN